MRVRATRPKMDGEEKLIVGQSGEYFLDHVDSKLRRRTASMYLLHFRRFLEWLKMDSQELYERHRDNLKSDEPINRMWLGKKLAEYQRYMRDELGYSTEDGTATGTVNLVSKSVASFFRSVGIDSIPSNGKIETVTKEIPIISKSQLRRVLEATGSYKMQAIIFVARDSGLRIGDVTRLKVGQLRPALDKEDLEYFTFTIIQSKTRRKADPVLGPESLTALRKWMRYRTEHIEILAPDDSPLFCIEKNKASYATKGGQKVKGIAKGGWMDSSTAGVVFGRLVRKAGIEKDMNGKRPSIHSLRKFNKTYLEYGGVPVSWINRLQGRKGQGSGQIYSKPNPRELIDVYKGAYHALQLETAEPREDIEDLRRQLRQKDMELKEFKEDVRGQMDEMRRIVETMTAVKKTTEN